jgi:PAS domain S-box-containing protein
LDHKAYKKTAEWQAKEALRLKQLEDYQILDTEDDAHFDQVTKIAAGLCDTPVAVITFLDSERQWFKSKVGLDTTQTPRDIAFCDYGIEQDDVFVVPDATADERFSSNPLVTGPMGVRFYAGAPLITPENNRLGMICVIDTKPRTLTPAQTDMLQLLAKQVMDQIELKNVARILVLRNKELRDTQRELRSNTQFMSQMIASLPVGVFCKDAKKNFEHIIFNPAASKAFGWPVDEVMGKTDVLRRKTPETADFINAQDQQIIRTGVASGVQEFTYEVSGKGLRMFQIHTSAMKNLDGENQFILGVVQDITEKKETEALLTHTAKMSSLGEMASGIAHEINNPLAVIRSRAQTLKELLVEGALTPETIAATAEKIDATAVRISKIIAGLRKFARQGSNDPFAITPLYEVVDSAIELCQANLKRDNIELQVAGVDTAFTLECRSVEVTQVLVNLISNARDAVLESEEKWIKVEAIEAGERIQIHVTDSGLGVPSQLREKIMQPFFTTKEVGRGTGLGLSISKGIVDSHLGTLRLDPKSKHTCFVVDMPKTQVASNEAKAKFEKVG